MKIIKNIPASSLPFARQSATGTPLKLAGNFYFMEQEIWKDVIGYENYMISNFGKLIAKPRKSNCKNNSKSYHKETFFKLKCKTHGYIRVYLSKNKVKKSFAFHRLLAEHFIPNPENKPQINHINGIRYDNRLENLEWTTQSENMIHSYRVLGQISGLNGRVGVLSPVSKKVIAIFNDGTSKKYDTITLAANELNLHNGLITKVLKRERNHTGGIKFNYIP